MKEKKFVYGFLAVLIAIIVVGSGWIALNNISSSQPHQLYDYSDASASLPRDISAGDSIHIDWRGYPDPDLYSFTKPRAYATVSIDLTVLLIPEATFRARSS